MHYSGCAKIFILFLALCVAVTIEIDIAGLLQSPADDTASNPEAGDTAPLAFRLSPDDEERLTSEQKHADLLEKVIKFGLNQSQYLIEIQVFTVFKCVCIYVPYIQIVLEFPPNTDL